MNENTRSHHESRSLLPHQQALIDRFFAEPSIRGFAVRWDTGLGKGVAATHVIKRLLTAQPTARVLVLCPKALQYQHQHRLREIEVAAEVVDRFRYREMQDATPSVDTVWREGVVFLLGVDFAKQDDIALSLSLVSWTLLVVDEAHRLRGQREVVVRKLVASSPELRVLLLSATGISDLPNLGIGPWTEMKVRAADVVDASGQRLFDQPPPALQVVAYHLHDSERRLRAAAAEVLSLMRESNNAPGIWGSVFASLVSSSPSALEASLRRLRNRLVLEASMFPPLDDELEDVTQDDEVPAMPTANSAKLLEALDRCLAELDSLEVDSKLSALESLLGSRAAMATVPRSMCIFTMFRATQLYLQTALEDMGFAPYALHGTMSPEERAYTTQRFREQGGVLIATAAVLEGFSMPQVDSLVMYDLPRGQAMLQQLMGRFQRIGRKAPLTVSVLLEGKTGRTQERVVMSTLLERLADDERWVIDEGQAPEE